MADILIDNQAAPSTPGTGKSVLWVDSTSKRSIQTDDAGLRHGILSTRVVTTQQAIVTSDTYLTNAGILVPSYGFESGQIYRWFIHLNKSGAGTAACAIQIRVGAAQTTGDTSLVTCTGGTAASSGTAGGIVVVTMMPRTISGTGVVIGAWSPGQISFIGQGITTVGGAVDNTGKGGQYVGLSINPGASTTWTIESTYAELVS